MPVVYLVVFAVVNAGCVCWLKNQQSIVVVEIVATRTVEAVVLLCLVIEKSIEEQYSTNGSCRNRCSMNCVCQLWQCECQTSIMVNLQVEQLVGNDL